MGVQAIFGNHLRTRYTFMIVHTVLLVFILLFTVLATKDFLILVFHIIAVGPILIYLLPAAILCLRNRESGYERGWVEIFYLTHEIMWSLVVLVWVAGFAREPDICANAIPVDPNGRWRLRHYSPYYLTHWRYKYNTYKVCQYFAVTIAFTALHTLVLLVWFGWTLWLATKVGKTMGGAEEGWTQDKVLKKVSMGKMVKLHQWREGEGVGLAKVTDQTTA